MDTLPSHTNFNIRTNVKQIARAYKTGEFPDAYCMFTTSLDSVTCITSESGQVITTENGRGLSIDGN